MAFLQVEIDDASLVAEAGETVKSIKARLQEALQSAARVCRAAAKKSATNPFLQKNSGYSIKRTKVDADLKGEVVLHEKGVRHETGTKRGKTIAYVSEGHGAMLAPAPYRAKGLGAWLQRHGVKIGAKTTAFPLGAKAPSPWEPAAEAAMPRAEEAFMETLLENK